MQFIITFNYLLPLLLPIELWFAIEKLAVNKTHKITKTVTESQC